MPGFDAATGTITVPIWTAGAASAILVVAVVLAIARAGAAAASQSLFRVVVIAAVIYGGWVYLQGTAQQEHAAARRALDERSAALTRSAVAPGSALACLDELAGERVEIACEKAVFANPETVAAAVSYITAKLALLADGSAYARQIDPAYAAELEPLAQRLGTRPLRLRGARPGGPGRLHNGRMCGVGSFSRWKQGARQFAQRHVRRRAWQIRRALERTGGHTRRARGGRGGGTDRGAATDARPRAGAGVATLRFPVVPFNSRRQHHGCRTGDAGGGPEPAAAGGCTSDGRPGAAAPAAPEPAVGDHSRAAARAGPAAGGGDRSGARRTTLARPMMVGGGHRIVVSAVRMVTTCSPRS